MPLRAKKRWEVWLSLYDNFHMILWWFAMCSRGSGRGGGTVAISHRYDLTLQESRYKSPLLCWPRLICIQTRPVRYLAAKTIATELVAARKWFFPELVHYGTKDSNSFQTPWFSLKTLKLAVLLSWWIEERYLSQCAPGFSNPNQKVHGLFHFYYTSIRITVPNQLKKTSVIGLPKFTIVNMTENAINMLVLV